MACTSAITVGEINCMYSGVRIGRIDWLVVEPVGNACSLFEPHQFLV